MDHRVLQPSEDTSSLSGQVISFTILLSVPFTPFPSKQMHSMQDVFLHPGQLAAVRLPFQECWITLLADFSSQEWMPSSPFASPSLVSSAVTCTSVWAERCIVPRDTVFKNSSYILCRVLHMLDHIHRFGSAPSYFGFLYSLSYLHVGVFCRYAPLFCSQIPTWALDNEGEYLAF